MAEAWYEEAYCAYTQLRSVLTNKEPKPLREFIHMMDEVIGYLFAYKTMALTAGIVTLEKLESYVEEISQKLPLTAKMLREKLLEE